MFTTEVTLHEKTRPTTTGSINKEKNLISSNGSLKVRMLK